MQRFEYFTDDDVQKIHEATLRVLETVGVDFGYEPAVEVFKKAGCKVEGQRIFLSPKMVMEQVAKAPSEFTLQARNPEKNVIIGGDHIAYIPCYGPPFVHDMDRGRRESTLEDYTNFVKLSYASKSIDITGGMMAEPNDIPHARRNAEMMLASMRYSDKPFMGGAIGAEAARETIEMAAILFGCSEAALAEKMPMISILCTRTPLAYDDRMLGAIMEYAKAGMPQLIREGTPVVFSGSSSAAAMRYGTLSIGAPEMAVNTAATAQMARFYGIPSRGGGAITDSKLPDAQAGMESMMSQLMATLSGVHFVLHSAGILEGYMTASYEKFVIDDEICGMCKRIKRGEQADPAKLALDVIAQVGPGGEYLTNMHTFQNFRKEFYTPIMEQKEAYAGWKEKGGEPIERAANRKWKEILDAYQEPGMPDDTIGELKNYIEKKYGK